MEEKLKNLITVNLTSTLKPFFLFLRYLVLDKSLMNEKCALVHSVLNKICKYSALFTENKTGLNPLLRAAQREGRVVKKEKSNTE